MLYSGRYGEYDLLFSANYFKELVESSIKKNKGLSERIEEKRKNNNISAQKLANRDFPCVIMFYLFTFNIELCRVNNKLSYFVLTFSFIVHKLAD